MTNKKKTKHDMDKKSKNKPNFSFVENQIRKKNFGIFSSIDENGNSHSTGIIYAASPPGSRLSLYLLTGKKYKKVRNVKNNPSVSFVIPFPHHILRFVPSSCVQFQGSAELLSFNNSQAQEAFLMGSKIVQMNLKEAESMEQPQDELTFIKIIPNQKIFCYGLGISLFKLRKDIESGTYSVIVPK